MRLRVAALLVVAVLPATLAGQLVRGYVGGGGGVITPLGSFGDVEKVGWHVWGAALRPLGPSWAVTVDALYGQTGHSGGEPGHTSLFGGTAGLALFLGDATRRIRPFAAAGVGVYSVDVNVEGAFSAAAVKVAPVVGGGVILGSGGRRAFLMARYVSVRTAPEGTSFLPISAGIALQVGGR